MKQANRTVSPVLTLAIKTYQTLSLPTRDFSIFSRWPDVVLVRLACAHEGSPPPLSLGQWLSIYTHLSVVVRITVVIKASLKNFFCFVLVYETK